MVAAQLEFPFSIQSQTRRSTVPCQGSKIGTSIVP